MVFVASFDVFETVLVRPVGEPAAVFDLLARQLRQQGLVDDAAGFAAARREAERRARRRRRPALDPTIDEVYDQLAWALCWEDGRRDLVLTRELELEAALLGPHPGGAARVEQARRLGLVVVFTSDTYLPASFVEQQLAAHGLFRGGDRLLISCEQAGTKRGGGLFEALVELTGVPAKRIVHVGNHPDADVRAARRAGLRATAMFSGNLTADEQRLDAHRAASGGLASVLAGAGRLARLHAPDDELDPALRDAAADVAGPALVAYVLWIVRRAQAQGLEVVYFLSREGQALLEVARILVDRLELPIEVRYLYASRQSLNMAAIDGGSRAELAWTLTHAETNTVRVLLQRLRLSPEEVADELARLGITGEQWDQVPAAAVRTRLFAAIADGPLQPVVQARAEQLREVALAYLEQEGALTDRPCGVVDVSGVGSQFKAFARLRASVGREPAQGFLFVRSRDPYLVAEGGYAEVRQPPIAVYLDDDVTGLGLGAPRGLVQLLEMFCAADHPTVLDYRQTDAGVEPVLAEGTADHLIAWGLGSVRGMLRCFAAQLWLDERHVDLDGDVRPAIRELLDRFWSQPSAPEARAWGAHPFDGTSGSEQPVPLATGMSGVDLLAALRRGAVVGDNWFSWRAASERLSPLPVRAALRLARGAKHGAQRVARRIA